MPRCEVCHGTIRTKMAMTHDQDPCFIISRMEFDAEVGWPRGKKTYLCTRECAIEAIEDGLLRDPDSSTFHAMRHDYEPGEAEPDVGKLLERARELLVDARDQLDKDEDAWDYIQGAAGRAESAKVVVDGPEVLEDTTSDTEQSEDGKLQTEYLCRWCGLSREECCCDSPEFEQHGCCQSCGYWYSNEILADANDISEPEHLVCPDCHATDTDQSDTSMEGSR